MADDSEASGESESAGVPSRPIASTTSVPREKPVIEGHAEEIAAEEPLGDVPPGDLFAPLVRPPEAEDAEPRQDVAEAEPDAPRPRKPGVRLWPFAVGIVVVALLAVGGAFGLHMLDGMMANSPGPTLAARVTVLEHRPDLTGDLQVARAALEKRIGALEVASGDVATAVSSLHADVDKLAAQKAAPAPTAALDLASLEARVGGLEQKLAALDSKVGALTDRLNAEKSQVNASENRVSQSATARADSEAIAILAASLLREVDSGAPYDTDLAALANRGLDKTKLAPLEPAAPTGVATPAALAKQFSDLSPAILATEPLPKESGFLDHLVNGAKRLIRVEKVGDTSGNDLAARVARIQTALDSGAVETAYQEWSALPDSAKAKSESFGDAAKARIDAVASARSIDADAVAALGRAKS
jgi:hypothetical protein